MLLMSAVVELQGSPSLGECRRTTGFSVRWTWVLAPGSPALNSPEDRHLFDICLETGSLETFTVKGRIYLYARGAKKAIPKIVSQLNRET